MPLTSADLLADQRARLAVIAAMTGPADDLDPHGDEARGIDPDAQYDAHREDIL